jgi:hypothetical protein
MNKALELLIAFQTRMLLAREERGQGTLEYVGMTIVASILVVAVLQAVGAIDLGGVFTTAVESVTSGG